MISSVGAANGGGISSRASSDRERISQAVGGGTDGSSCSVSNDLRSAKFLGSAEGVGAGTRDDESAEVQSNLKQQVIIIKNRIVLPLPHSIQLTLAEKQFIPFIDACTLFKNKHVLCKSI